MDISKLERIISDAGRWSEVLAENRAFLRLAGSCRRHVGLSLDIRIVRWKFKRIAGNPPKSRNFSARAGNFRSSAGKAKNLQNFSDFLQIFYFSSGRFVFSAGDFIFQEIF